MTYLSDEQVQLLLKPIHPKRVLMRDGMSYVEGYDIKAELNRVFGFGRWSVDILSQDLICETATKTRNGKDAWYVVYKSSLRLTICAPDGSPVARYEESHVGESTHPVRGEAHGNALTNSWTYALKRCASNLGDQFGLSLYGKGSMDALVRWTLVRPEQAAEAGTTDTDDVPQVSAEEPGSPSAPEAESAADAFDASEPAEVAHAPRDVSEPEAADEARMIRAAQTPDGDAEPRDPWLKAALKAAPTAGLEACSALWQKSVERVADGTLAKADAAKLHNILRPRMLKLKAAPASPVAADLDPDDEWAAKVEEIPEGDDLAAAEVLEEASRMLGADELDADHYARIVAAVDAKFPQLSGEGKAAA